MSTDARQLPRDGHTPTLVASFMHFDLVFHALGARWCPRRVHLLLLSDVEAGLKGLIVGVPILTGSPPPRPAWVVVVIASADAGLASAC